MSIKSIEKVLNGYIVEVGCQKVVFRSKKKLLKELDRYLADPDGVEREYLSKYPEKYIPFRRQADYDSVVSTATGATVSVPRGLGRAINGVGFGREYRGRFVNGDTFEFEPMCANEEVIREDGD